MSIPIQTKGKLSPEMERVIEEAIEDTVVKAYTCGYRLRGGQFHGELLPEILRTLVLCAREKAAQRAVEVVELAAEREHRQAQEIAVRHAAKDLRKEFSLDD